jgi:hypothetical protein
MEFIITGPNTYNRPPHGFAGNSRYETTTDVKFVNDTTLVVANRMAAMLQLVEFDISTKTIQIIDTVSLTYRSENLSIINGRLGRRTDPKFPDLIAIHNDTVYVATLDNTISKIQIVNRKFMKPTLITLNHNGFYHGITIHPTCKNVAYLSSAMTTPKLVIADLLTRKTQDIILPGFEGKVVRQTRFLDETHIVSTCGGSLVSSTDHNKVYDSWVGVFILPSFKCLDLVEFPSTHIDDICVHSGVIYITNQCATEAKVCKYKFDGKLQKLEEIEVGGFPHGIDARNGLLAVTSMSRSSVQLIRI